MKERNPKEIKVFAPATVANVACGFDIFGFALETPGDEVYVALSDVPGVRLSKITGDEGRLPLEAQKNTASVSVLKLLEHIQSKQGFEIELHKKMPLGSGLGSSAASAVGSLFAVNALLGYPLSARELLPFAMESERVACGAAHADNVAPSLLGGFILIRSYAPLDVVQVPCKLDLYCTLLHPKIEIRTEISRKILKPEISMSQHVIQTGNAAGLIVGLIQGDAELIRRSLHDVIAEPVRSALIPGFKSIKAAAIEAGALGCSISGSGPSLFALSLDQNQAEKIGKAMGKACQEKGLDCDLYVSKINFQGPKILSW
jgi:homoserine kinase